MTGSKPAAEAATPSTPTCTCGTHEGDLVRRIDSQGAVTCYAYHSRQILRLRFNSDGEGFLRAMSTAAGKTPEPEDFDQRNVHVHDSQAADRAAHVGVIPI
jgi:hypothetical protein